MRFEQEKNALFALIDEAIGLLNTEMRIVKWRIKYPEQFKQRANKLFLSPFHLAEKISLVNIMEIVSGLFLSKHIVYQNGEHQLFFVEVFFCVYHITHNRTILSCLMYPQSTVVVFNQVFTA